MIILRLQTNEKFKMLKNFFVYLFALFTTLQFIRGDNFVRTNGTGKNVELYVRNSLPDFSWAHNPPLGPLEDPWCYYGVGILYGDKNYEELSALFGLGYENCLIGHLQGVNSIRLLGVKSSKILHLWERTSFEGTVMRSFTMDQADYTNNTSSLYVVGTDVSVTFYSMPNYAGADICLQVGIGIYKYISDIQASWGFTLIKSFRFGCFSKNIFNNPA